VIAWWWLLVVPLAVWVQLVVVAAARDEEVMRAVEIVVYATVALPVLPLVWLLTRLDIGAVPLDPRALSQFARMRTVDKRPAWCFFVWRRGVILLRRWDVGSDRRKVELRVRDDDPPLVRYTGGRRE
jgi:hypothetical protein